MTVNLPYTDAHLLCDLFPVQKTEILQPQDLVILRVVHILQSGHKFGVEIITQHDLCIQGFLGSFNTFYSSCQTLPITAAARHSGQLLRGTTGVTFCFI